MNNSNHNTSEKKQNRLKKEKIEREKGATRKKKKNFQIINYLLLQIAKIFFNNR